MNVSQLRRFQQNAYDIKNGKPFGPYSRLIEFVIAAAFVSGIAVMSHMAESHEVSIRSKPAAHKIKHHDGERKDGAVLLHHQSETGPQALAKCYVNGVINHLPANICRQFQRVIFCTSVILTEPDGV